MPNGNLLAYGRNIVGGYSSNGGGSGGGGHVIQDSAGNNMPQQDILQISGYNQVTNDATNGKTIINDAPTSVTWTVWQEMTAQQKAGKKWLITDVPDAESTVTVENMKLAWENPSPTASFPAGAITLATDGNYDFLRVMFLVGLRMISVDVAKGYGGHCSFAGTSGSGAQNINYCREFVYVSDTEISFTDGLTQYSSSNRNVDNSTIKPLYVYTYKRSIKVEFSSIAENVSTLASKCMLSGGNSVESAINRGNVSVTANGTKTYRQLFIELWALVDTSKVTNQTVFAFNYNNSAHTRYVYPLTEQSDTYLVFSRGSANSSGARIESIQIDTTGAYLISIGSTRTDSSTQVPSSGWSFAIEY